MKKLPLLLLGLVAVIILAIPASAGAVTVAPVPSQSSVTLNDTFNVDVTISGNTINVSAMDFRLDFDKTKLQVVDYQAGNFMSTSLVPALSGADKTTCINYANNDGIIGAGLTGANSATSGKVLTITFKAIATGQASLNVATSSLKPSGQSSVVTALVSQATVTINEGEQTLIGDFTGDNKVNFSDLMIFQDAWNHKAGDTGWDQVVSGVSGSPFNRCDIAPAQGTYPNLTISKDGKVNFSDLMVFADAWAWAVAHK